MTRIVFRRRDGIFYGFEEIGHTGYGDAGEDVLCAALSAMTMLIVNAIEVSYDSNIDYSIDEQTAEITVLAKAALPECEEDEKKQYAVAGLLNGFYIQLTDMLEDYYDYIEVEVIEDPQI